MTKQIVKVLAGVPGCGKSTRMLYEAASTPARYLFCLPTIQLIEEQAKFFRKQNPRAACVPIHSKGNGRSSVSRQIAELADAYTDGDHLAAFITHEAMMDSDLSPFIGWHARIDEPPNAITCGQISISQSVAAFQQRFHLKPFGSGWAQLTPLLGRQPWKEIAKDTLWRGSTDFLKLVDRPQGVLVELDNWSQAKNLAQVPWFSLWTPTQMASFSSVMIAGAGFLSSTAYNVMRSTYGAELDFHVVELGAARSEQPRICIMYFTHGHVGSTTYWASSDGRKCLVQIERWLSENVPNLGFWSGNEVVRESFEHRAPGAMVRPKVAGVNLYRDHSSCAFLYSGKPLPQDDTLKTVFQLTHADILTAREEEDIFQFVFRGAIRDTNYAGAYDVYLYSLDQAERLQDNLITQGFADVTLSPVEGAGIMEVKRLQKARTTVLTSGQTDARAKKRKAANALANRELRARKKILKLASTKTP